MATQNQKNAANKNGGEGQQPPAQQPPFQQIEAVVCPVEVWEQIKNGLRKLPVEDVEVLLLTMKAMRPQIVNMQQGPGQ